MRKTGWLALGLVFAVPAASTAAEPVLAKAAEAASAARNLESLRQRAVDAYDAKEYAQSEKLFYELLAADSSGPLGRSAYEYLQRIAIGSGAVDYAIKHYRDLKALNLVTEDPAAIASRLTSINAIRAAGKIQGHLASIFKVGGVLAARASLFGFLIEGMGLSSEAAYYLDRADQLIREVQRQAYTAMRAYLVERPLQYAFPGDIYRRIGVPFYSPGQYQVISFRQQQGEYSDLQLQTSLDGWKPHVTFLFSPTYDSNVVNATPLTTPLNTDQNAVLVHDFLINVGVQGNVNRPLSYGFDYTYFSHAPMRGDLGPFDTKSHIGSIWVSMWNRVDDEARFRFDTSFTSHDPSQLRDYSRSLGPQISWAHLWNRLYRLDLSYGYKFNKEYTDISTGALRRGGHEHVIAFQLSYPGKSANIQPYGGYVFDRNLTDGWEYATITHGFRAGTYYLIGEHASAELGGSVDFVIYPTSSVPRSDVVKNLKLGVSLPVLDKYFVFLVNLDYTFQSSVVPSLNFNRWRAGLSTVIHLDI